MQTAEDLSGRDSREKKVESMQLLRHLPVRHAGHFIRRLFMDESSPDGDEGRREMLSMINIQIGQRAGQSVQNREEIPWRNLR